MPKENPGDTIIVHNIDVDCDAVTQDMVTRHKEVYDERIEKNKTISIKEPEEWSHKDYFQVKWDGHPHRIKPGETRLMPRYIANQFKKHLTNHILLKREEKSGEKGLMSNPVEKAKVEKQIIVGVESWFHEDEAPTPGEVGAKQVESLNKPEAKAPQAPQVVPKPPVQAQPKAKQEPTDVAKTNIWDDKKPNPTRKELLKECEDNDLETTGKETVDELIGKIKALTP